MIFFLSYNLGNMKYIFQDEFNDGWFDVLGFGAISGMNGNNILSSIDAFEALENIGTNSGPKFVQIGPVEVGIYREISVQYDPIHGGPDAGRGSELVGTRKDKVALSISPELEIRLKTQYQPLDLDDDDLGF